MARHLIRIAWVVLVGTGFQPVGFAEPPRLGVDAERDYRAWGAGQLLALRAGLPAVPLASPEVRPGVSALSMVTTTLGSSIPTPTPGDLSDLRARARWLLRGEGLRVVESIQGKHGERAGALARLATLLPVLGSAWPRDPAPTGTPLFEELLRSLRPARLPTRLLEKIYRLQAGTPQAVVVATATLETLRVIPEYLYWEAISPTQADVASVAWDLGIMLGTVELRVLNERISEEDRTRLAANCARIGVAPPDLPAERIQGDPALRAHMVRLRIGWGIPAYERITKRNGAEVADWVRLGWRLALPEVFDIGESRPVEARARELEQIATRLRIPGAAWTPLVDALRTKQTKVVLTERVQAMRKAVGAQLMAGVEGRAGSPPAAPSVDVAAGKRSLYVVGLFLASSVLGIAARPEQADGWLRLRGAVDAADELGLMIPPLPVRRGDTSADTEAAITYLRRGPGEALGARIERRAGAVGRAYFDIGIRSALLDALYEPGSERTLRIAEALEDALRKVGTDRDPWREVLDSVKAGAPREKVTPHLAVTQMEFLGRKLFDPEADESWEEDWR